MLKEIYPQNSFGSSEHVPSFKLNAILRINEEARRFIGPFSISKLVATSTTYSPTATSYLLQLEDDPWVIGGVNTNASPATTIKRFTVEYYNGSKSLVTGFARWDNVVFTSGTIEGYTRWWTTLTSGTTVTGTVGLGGINMTGSSVNISGFACFRYS